ncbi:hypothetical protein BHE90_012994 [Fusarium euwallaceae]|uniref:Extradiol ring-cleavage dioxygenase class III enzyme subunit B domain-containing protein n=1 Tax=Fusarium euwallaceae TaxID=1147111 RepID=A0A430LAB8_9HYPO|nr:hypothetical protein BHE90_012994 [Fusarium euwallaceae]
MAASKSTNRAPALFISHGGGPFPVFLEDHESYRQMLRDQAHYFDNVRAIIVLTAHWETDQPHITGSDNPEIFYDYDLEGMRSRLPKEAFQIEYKGKGNSELASSIAERLRTAGFTPVVENRAWDHGVYVPLGIMFPDGNIPIVQMSILRGDSEQDVTEKNIRLGEALEEFRDQGFAVVGSGGSCHDFSVVGAAYFDPEDKLPWPPREIQLFEDFLRDGAQTKDKGQRLKFLRGWPEAPGRHLAHVPGSVEHLMPYIAIAASAGNDSGRRLGQWDFKGTPYGVYMWEADSS